MVAFVVQTSRYFGPCRILPYPAVSCRILRICRILPYPAVFLRRLKLHGTKRQKVPKIHGLKKYQKNHSLVCKKSSRF